jgi:hypothetical protein
VAEATVTTSTPPPPPSSNASSRPSYQTTSGNGSTAAAEAVEAEAWGKGLWEGICVLRPPVSSPPPLPVAPKDSKYFVSFIVTLPYTKADFDKDKQTKYRNAVAMAAATIPDNVDILSITEARRRGGFVKAETKVRATEETGMTALATALGTGDALKNKLSTALKAQGLAEATGVNAEATGEATGVTDPGKPHPPESPGPLID